MFRDRWLWLLNGLIIIVVAGGTAFFVGTAIRTKLEQGGISPPTVLGPSETAPPQRTPAPAAGPPSPAGPTAAPRPQTSLTPAPPQPPAGRDRRTTAAWRLLTAGRLREAQEEFLQVLLTTPGNQEAMLGLVAVRRRLTRDDPVVLRRQAAAYQQAMIRRAETEEHYTVEAMALLAQANLLAASEIEAERGTSPPSVAAATPPPVAVRTPPSPRAEGPRVAETPAARPTRPRPTTPPVAQAVPTPPPASPQATPRAPAPAIPAPQTTAAESPLDVNEPFFVVQIGPVADSGRVSEIVGELTLSGYTAGVRRREEPQSFRVVSETLARDAADRRAQALVGFGFRSRLIVLAGGLAQLEFGVFPSPEGAEALASRIRTHGYHTLVIREGGTLYVITAGPYRQSVANAIVKIIRSRFGGGLGVTVSPAP